jgi:hypothetical protein
MYTGTVTNHEISTKENKREKPPMLWSCYHRSYIFYFGRTEKNTNGYIWMMAVAGRNIGHKTFNCIG